MKIIDSHLISQLQQEAQANPRLRKNYNFHLEDSDRLQRMLNAIEPDSYVQPHRHQNPAKREMFVILKGRMAVFIFDDDGVIIRKVLLDAHMGNWGIEILPHEWHSIVALEKGSVVFEVKDGPYVAADDKLFAPWAPKPDTPEAHIFLTRLRSHINE